jgi:hypothetical protein
MLEETLKRYGAGEIGRLGLTLRYGFCCCDFGVADCYGAVVVLGHADGPLG